MDKPCDICGDKGVFEAIVTCCKCKIARQHLYCMRIFRTEVPPFWSCEECDQNKLVSPKPSLKEHSREGSTPKATSLMQTTTRVSGGQNKNAFASRFNFKEQRVHTGRTKYISCEEAVKLSSFAKQPDPPSKNAFSSSSKHIPPQRVKTLVKTPQQERITKFEPYSPQPVVQKSAGLKAEKAAPPLRNRGDDASQSIKSCKRERTNTERERESISTERESKTLKSEVLPPRKEVNDTRMHIEVPKSSKMSEIANTKSDTRMHIEVSKSSKMSEIANTKSDTRMHIEVSKSSKMSEIANTKSDTRMHIEVPKSSKISEIANTKSDTRMHIDVPKSSKISEIANTKSDTRMHIEVPKSSKISEIANTKSDTRMHIEVPKSSKISEIANTKSGSKNHANMEAGSSDAGKSNVTKDISVSEKNCPYVPALHSYWNGSFYLPNGHESFNDAFKAHPPSSVHNKVFDTLKKMPENIYFELIPKHEVWTDIFQDYCPDNDDIGLYFFPSSKKSYLMDFLWRENLVMRSSVDGVELLVLSSRLLQPHSQEFQGDYFLWGVFRRIRQPNILKKAVADKRPLLEVKRERCDCPPGFEQIGKR